VDGGVSRAIPLLAFGKINRRASKDGSRVREDDCKEGDAENVSDGRGCECVPSFVRHSRGSGESTRLLDDV